jgi:SAM-dependent methyltransferase
MPDRLFADRRLAAIYDDVDNDRSDLDHYEEIIIELGAHRVLDVGCGTGVLACRLARRGFEVVGADPAAASLEIARAKRGADAVTWLHGDATALPPMHVDVAVMTGNAAQVFLTDTAWLRALRGLRQAVADGGHFVFESRDPAARGWERWRDQPPAIVNTSAGPVEHTIKLTAVELPLVSFRLTYRFLATGELLVSDSTLRFRERSELEDSLAESGFDVVEVRDAPDRPGREFVLIARASRTRAR